MRIVGGNGVRARVWLAGSWLALGLWGCDGAPVGVERTDTIGAARTKEAVVGGTFSVTRGLFSAESDPGAGGYSDYLFRGVSLGDCNQDGLVDAFESTSGKVWVQSADGTFAQHGSVPSDGDAAVFVDLALDASGSDGIEDLVLGSQRTVAVARGLGDCTFAAPQPIASVPANGWPAQILVRDVDLDGLADLAISTSNSTTSPYRLLVARGDGEFDDATGPAPLAATRDWGYASYTTYFDDVDGDGQQDQFIIVDNQLSSFAYGQHTDMPSFELDPTLTDTCNVSSPMGITALDLDRDGRTDYFLPRGASSAVLRNRGPRDVVDVGPQAGLHAPGEFQDWGTLAFDADLDGWTDLLVLRLIDQTYAPGPVGLLLDRHDGSFTDVGSAVFGDTALRAKALVCGDLKSNGKMSCFAREPAGNLLLENHLETTAHWLGIRLRGTVSSADASGARVSLDGEDRPLVLVADGQSPTWGEHRRDVLLPIGDRPSGSVTIHWPSGLVQSVPDLPANAYATVTEPRVLTVSTRVAPADGKTLITVDVDPALAGATTFDLALDGAGSWAGPLVQRIDGTWTRGLVAPAQPGTARLTLSLDGKALTVRPRLRFTAP